MIVKVIQTRKRRGKQQPAKQATADSNGHAGQLPLAVIDVATADDQHDDDRAADQDGGGAEEFEVVSVAADIVEPGTDLVWMAHAINECHSEVLKAAGTAWESAIAVGKGLIDAKRVVPYGQWGKWVEANCEFSRRTASRYMWLASKDASLGVVRPTVADLGSLRKILAAIAVSQADNADVEDTTESDEGEGDQEEGRSDGGAGADQEADEDVRADDGESDDPTESDDSAEAEQKTVDGGDDDGQQADEEPKGEPSGDHQQDPVEHLLGGFGLTVDEQRRLLAAVDRQVKELLKLVAREARWRGKSVIVHSHGEWDMQPAEVAVLIGARLKESFDPKKDVPRVPTKSRPAAAW